MSTENPFGQIDIGIIDKMGQSYNRMVQVVFSIQNNLNNVGGIVNFWYSKTIEVPCTNSGEAILTEWKLGIQGFEGTEKDLRHYVVAQQMAEGVPMEGAVPHKLQDMSFELSMSLGVHLPNLMAAMSKKYSNSNMTNWPSVHHICVGDSCPRRGGYMRGLQQDTKEATYDGRIGKSPLCRTTEQGDKNGSKRTNRTF